MTLMGIIRFLVALLPIAAVLYLMIGRKWGGSQAGPAGWAVAVVISLLFFGANVTLLVVAFGRAILLALYVLYIIWMALLLYHVVNEAGAIKVIGQELPRLAGDEAAQALLLAWVFGSFLQGASGFGVPAAVVAPLLVGLNFRPTTAVAVALIGHAWAVSFGSLGSSFFALNAATGVAGELLAGPAAIYLGVCCFLCGGVVLWSAAGWQGFRQRGLLFALLGIVMSVVQYLIAQAGLWSLAAFGAGLAGLIAIGIVLSLTARTGRSAAGGESLNRGRLGRAFLPYAILTVVIVAGQLFFGDRLDGVVLNWSFPEVVTRQGWITPAGFGRSISLFGHAGALLLYASALSFIWFARWGVLIDKGNKDSGYSARDIIGKTVRGSRKSTISIITLVAMATTMQHAGMTQILAETLSNTGTLFAFISPFIGALGAFMTGSNTNSNVVFGDLQQQTALVLQLSVPVVLAAQTAGGAIGSIFAPAKVVVGCSTVEGANDGDVLKLATLYGLSITAIVGVLTIFLA